MAISIALVIIIIAFRMKINDLRKKITELKNEEDNSSNY